MWPFEWNYIPFLIYGSAVYFLLPKCVFFLPMVFIESCFHVFHHDNMCLWLLWNSVGKKNTHLAKVWFEFSLPKCCIFTLAFWWYCTNSLVSLEMQKKQMARALLPLSSRRDLRTLDPANQCSKKTTSLPAHFCCIYFPRSVLYWHCLLTV